MINKWLMYCSQSRYFQNSGSINTGTGHMNSDDPERRIEAQLSPILPLRAISSYTEGMNKYLMNSKNIQRVERKLKVNGACLKKAFCWCSPRHHICSIVVISFIHGRNDQDNPASQAQAGLCMDCWYFEKRGSEPHIEVWSLFESSQCCGSEWTLISKSVMAMTIWYSSAMPKSSHEDKIGKIEMELMEGWDPRFKCRFLVTQRQAYDV